MREQMDLKPEHFSLAEMILTNWHWKEARLLDSGLCQATLPLVVTRLAACKLVQPQLIIWNVIYCCKHIMICVGRTRFTVADCEDEPVALLSLARVLKLQDLDRFNGL